MPIDFRIKTFETSAVGLRDEIGILAGVGNPWDEYINVPEGSLYIKKNGYMYRKSGPGDNMSNWTIYLTPDCCDDDDDDDDTYRNRWFWAFNGTQAGIQSPT